MAGKYGFEFDLSTKDGRAAYQREWRRIHRAKHLEAHRQSMREWRARNPERSRELVRKSAAKRRASMSVEQKEIERATHRAYQRARNRINPEACAAAQRRYKERHMDRIVAGNRRRQPMVKERQRGYKAQEYAAWVARFGEICWICKKPPVNNERLYLEHCQLTGEARGLAHKECNSALGFMREDLALAMALVEAVKRCDQIKADSPVRGFFKLPPRLRPRLMPRRTARQAS